MWSSSRRWVFLAGALVLLVLVGSWFKQRTGTAGRSQDQSGMPSSMSAARRERGGEGHSARQVADTWFAAASASQPGGQESSVITITSQDSPARRAAFRDLLGRVDRSNAAALHDLMSDAASNGDAGAFNDGEWNAFLEKWGRLDGLAALAHLEETQQLAWRAPDLLRGVAASDPDEALAWLQDHAPLEQDLPWRATAQRELIRGWLQSDFEGPAQWFRDHPDDPAFDEILAAFASEVAVKDVETAFEWAKAAEGPWRAFAMERVAREWLARDPQRASTELPKAGYTQEILEFLLAPDESHDITGLSKASPSAGLQVESGGAPCGD